MAVVHPDRLEEFLAITTRWDVEATVLGEVTAGTHLEVYWHEELVVDVPPRSVAHDGPVYERPYARPDYLDALQAAGTAGLTRPGDGAGLREVLVALLGSGEACDLSWITDQYDRYVRGNTAQAMPDDAGVVRVDEQTGRGVAIATDCNSRFVKLDPYAGAQLALAEAYRNVAIAGGEPLAVSDCLNFGSPEDPGVMWQFAQAVTALADGCQVLGTPVTGGNVSFYNQTGETAVHPTPLVAVLGVVDDVAQVNRSGWEVPGQAIFLLGHTREELDGSAWAHVLHDHLGGLPPKVDLAAEELLARTVSAAGRAGLIRAAHDVSTGGLAVSLVESVLRYGIGATIDLTLVRQADGIDAFVALFSESAARAVVSVDQTDAEAFSALCAEQGQPAARIGITGGDHLVINGEFRLSLHELTAARRGVIERALGA